MNNVKVYDVKQEIWVMNKVTGEIKYKITTTNPKRSLNKIIKEIKDKIVKHEFTKSGEYYSLFITDSKGKLVYHALIFYIISKSKTDVLELINEM